MSEQNYSPFKIRYGSVSDWKNRSPNPDPGTLYFVTNEQGQCFMYFDSPVLENSSEQNSSQSGSENNTSQPFSIISEEDKQKIEQIILPPEPGEEVIDTETDSFLINYEQYQKLYDLRLNDSDKGETFYAPVLQGSNEDILKSNGDKTFSWVSGYEDKQALLGISYEQNRQYLITNSEKDNVAKLSNILKLKINGTNIGDLSQELNIYNPGLAGGQNYFLISNNSKEPSWSNDTRTLQSAIGISYISDRKYLITDNEKSNIEKLPQILKFSINGTMIDNFNTTDTHPIYAPTSSGNSGEVLISIGTGAPEWRTLANADIESASGNIIRGATKLIGLFTNLSNEIILASGSNSYYLQADYNNTHQALLKAGANEASLELDNQSNNGTKITGNQVKLPSTGNITIGNSQLTSSALKINNNTIFDGTNLTLPNNSVIKINGINVLTNTNVILPNTGAVKIGGTDILKIDYLYFPTDGAYIKINDTNVLTKTALTLPKTNGKVKVGDSELTSTSLKINNNTLANPITANTSNKYVRIGNFAICWGNINNNDFTNGIAKINLPVQFSSGYFTVLVTLLQNSSNPTQVGWTAHKLTQIDANNSNNSSFEIHMTSTASPRGSWTAMGTLS